MFFRLSGLGIWLFWVGCPSGLSWLITNLSITLLLESRRFRPGSRQSWDEGESSLVSSIPLLSILFLHPSLHSFPNYFAENCLCNRHYIGYWLGKESLIPALKEHDYNLWNCDDKTGHELNCGSTRDLSRSRHGVLRLSGGDKKNWGRQKLVR